ncbi:hypothetical protein PHLGIDRAFT_164927 [Phlebiopsis gigantea 11061_1 CR5-6]|uniref:Transcription factor domain-containing protein n=1 Tax=Phlebiopsis gigantea (strain 11061_1 CR5-6) TaxID=745531 RepID=A0A0C3S890_PHLG1|nr:hypothetical protein PHLGIDRAFT_164927 [Phlebiopsis gigantea 11061_1 CR5-6]
MSYHTTPPPDSAMGFDMPFLQWRTPSPSGLVPLTPQNGPPSVVEICPSMLSDPRRTIITAPSHTSSPYTPRSSLSKTSVLPNSSINLPCQDSYELRTLFLNHQIQLGFYLRDTKWQAVRSGDLSGRVIHPAVVYVAQLVGCFLWKLRHKTDVLVLSEDIEIRNVLNAVEALPPDPATLVMIYTVLGEYLLFKQQRELGRDYLVRASRVLAPQDLQLAAPSLEGLSSHTEPDEDTKEYLSAMAQLLYIDKATSMVLRLPFFLNAEYDRQLRSITIMQPWLARHSAIVMRCKSIWILREAMRLSQIRAAAASESKSSARLETALPVEWYTQYWETLEDAAQHVAVLYPQMLQASLTDFQQTLCLKVCIIVALAAQIELHRMPGYYHVESRQRAMCVIVEVIRLIRGLKEEDYALLEPTLGICFTIIANTLREDQSVRLELPPDCGPPQDTLSVLITVATQLSLKLPYVEPALHTLHELAATN